MAFRRRLGTNTTWYIQHGTCSPIWNGIGSGKALSLILLIVGHQATGGGFYSGNGRTSSSLTGLTSGLPISVTGPFSISAYAPKWKHGPRQAIEHWRGSWSTPPS